MIAESHGEEEGTKAAHSDPQHDSYIPLRPPKAKSTMHCTFKTMVVLLCEDLDQKVRRLRSGSSSGRRELEWYLLSHGNNP